VLSNWIDHDFDNLINLDAIKLILVVSYSVCLCFIRRFTLSCNTLVSNMFFNQRFILL